MVVVRGFFTTLIVVAGLATPLFTFAWAKSEQPAEVAVHDKVEPLSVR